MKSGQLVPKKSLVAIFPLAPMSARLRTVRDLIPCEACSLTPCPFRRAPYRDAAYLQESVSDSPEPISSTPVPPRAAPVRYDVNTKALARWARERLRIEPSGDGTLTAHFRYDGSTCSNMGQPLAFDYTVVLGPLAQGHRVLSTDCVAAPGTIGHQKMCGWQADAFGLGGAISSPPPFAGQLLEEALSWKPSTQPSGCLCSEASRNHKWRLVLQTLHYKLHERVKTAPVSG
jgi:hypothetical protein